MLQHLLRRLVFDVPILNEYAKMPLKVGRSLHMLKVQNKTFQLSSEILFFAFAFLPYHSF